jgi:ABC-type sugar transport system ATPase subunit
MTLTDLGATATVSIVSRARQLAEAVRLARFLGFSPNRLRSPARQLSGGNQQKLVIGKWLHKRPAVFLLDEPTRGIDVHAKSEVFRTVRQLSYDGMSVILVSSELEELVDNCDRILVMSRRHLIGEVMAAEASVNRLLAAIFAVDKDAA